ncbi:MAG: DUF402 domain-containing protein [Lachnospiraceae bacterium]|nr:DUF402 domain-containing protein [Robinsoniella sp.]MDY3765608.1 DUF402 domain-containing protein [Lachnospiraceae bacterium]
MDYPILYRKRLIPLECVLLKDDVILFQNESQIVTKWNTLHPKKDLHHGYSCYCLDKGIKVSKFLDADNNLLCWYCDIISYSFDPDTNTYVFTDLLADVILKPGEELKVVDLDELADACEQNLITTDQLILSLRQLDHLLKSIQNGEFHIYQDLLNRFDV